MTCLHHLDTVVCVGMTYESGQSLAEPWNPGGRHGNAASGPARIEVKCTVCGWKSNYTQTHLIDLKPEVARTIALNRERALHPPTY